MEHPEYQVFAISNGSSLELNELCLENCLGLSLDFNDRHVWSILADLLRDQVEAVMFDWATVDLIDGSAWNSIIPDSITVMLKRGGKFYFPVLSYRGTSLYRLSTDSPPRVPAPIWLRDHYPVFLLDFGQGPMIPFVDFEFGESFEQTIDREKRIALSGIDGVELHSARRGPGFDLRLSLSRDEGDASRNLLTLSRGAPRVASLLDLSYFYFVFGARSYQVLDNRTERSYPISTDRINRYVVGVKD
jgi:hypothetical protein